MILLRPIQVQDLRSLEQLAQVPGFINLPSDPDMLKTKILKSQESFQTAADPQQPTRLDSKYIFVAEDLETKKVLGTSMIAAQHGTPESPHFYFEVGNEKKFSSTINTGFIHGTLKLKYDSNGPSEIGGLVVDAEHRNTDARVGRQISFVRFLFLGLNKARFKKKLIAELLPPLNKKGQSPLWEAVGRRFTNMDYWEADQLCQKNKEFILSLFPTGKIYTSFLSAEARNAIGRVGKITEPVFHMLTKIGFKYKNEVDPFDGGPHLWADVDHLMPVKKLKTFSYSPELETGTVESGLICSLDSKTFKAVHAQCKMGAEMLSFAASGDSGESEAMVASVLELKPGDRVAFMPYY